MSSQVLDTIDAQRLGRELQRARKRSGVTQQKAADIIGVKRTTMIAIEQGERRIKSSELIALAEAYGRQVSDFVRPRPDFEPLDVQFRKSWADGGQAQDRADAAMAEFEDLCRDYLELEALTNSPLVRNYPKEYEIEGLPIDSTAEAIANNERSRLGLSERPVPLIRELLEQDVGLRVFYIEMDKNISEMYAYNERVGGCLAVNKFHPEERRRWSLAHGYFHFLATRRTPEVLFKDGYQRKPESERFADAFARYFLMPSAGLIRRFNDIAASSRVTPETLCTWANYYGVSVQAITERLESMRLLPTGTWEKVQANIRIRDLQQQLGLGEIPSQDSKVSVRFTYLALEAFRSGQLTEEMLARFLESSRLDARKVIELDLVPPFTVSKHNPEPSDLSPNSKTEN